MPLFFSILCQSYVAGFFPAAKHVRGVFFLPDLVSEIAISQKGPSVVLRAYFSSRKKMAVGLVLNSFREHFRAYDKS